ncbi:type II toxin-antitoxin system VapC family toxin [Reyranella sp.]|uniref:type II toxin-antitoxin system VapC family toxin n=1 Tax=Reyranella sp. TaxID=1929291 RepID=UPI003D14369F
MFCLDTNVVIAAINERSASVAERLDRELRRGTRLLVPSIVLFELRFGIANSAHRSSNERNLEIFLSTPIETPTFDQGDATEAADVRMFLKGKGTPIGPYDILIAAQARRRGATLVTANTREFRRVPRLPVEDWARP